MSIGRLQLRSAIRIGARAARLLLGAAALGAGNARADASPYVLAAGITTTHDSNLLALGDGGVAPAGFARTDAVTGAQLVGGFHKAYGRQHDYGNASIFGITLGEALAVYPNYYRRPDGSFERDRYTQPTLDLSAQYRPTAASAFEARLGYQHTRYDLDAPRDGSGATAPLNWTWQPSYRTRVLTRHAHDTGQNAYSTTVPTIDWSRFQIIDIQGISAYSQTYDTLRLQGETSSAPRPASPRPCRRSGAAWAIVQQRIEPLRQLPPARERPHDDALLRRALGPLRSVNFGCDDAATRRSAGGDPGLTYPLHDNIVSCHGQFLLQR
ncbi:MAG: hypothetical protein KGL18_01060 [Burkholderiales bacterium]|nr:hypothetical protein [Burkholderiales bacterium]MDE1926020.1 hypothetical protein [Burkholderiales bacterium]MDE2159807.1 hypothetical protein [Burkholderiales bacterium]MDE2501552.1 hypothetical protein [Burkholderiales bacterium]